MILLLIVIYVVCIVGVEILISLCGANDGDNDSAEDEESVF